ncbi:MAG: DEAD/DEAH box helicase family protein [Thermoprotei archaeon]
MQEAPKLPAFMKKKGIVPRDYQLNIYRSASQENTLVVLPTGLGKTAIAAMVAARRFEEFPDRKILVLAPTRPLAEQHLSSFRSMLEIEDMKLLTGEVDPDTRKWQWNHNSILFMTPQAVRNDLEDYRYDLTQVSLIVFDEAHHAVGDYPYVFIASRYMKECNAPLIMGLTASPGHTKEHLNEVLSNLFIKRIEARDERSPDVAPYVNDVKEERVVLDLPPEIKEVAGLFEILSQKYIERLSQFGIRFRGNRISTKYLLDVQQKLRQKIDSGTGDSSLFIAYGLLNDAIRVRHAKLLLEVEGVSSVLTYMEETEKGANNPEATRSLRFLVRDEAWASAKKTLMLLQGRGLEHPKVDVLIKAIENEVQDKTKKILVFTHYRETARVISSLLSSVKGARVAPFLGQASRGYERGMTQKDQMKVLEDFRNGALNVLVATQVAEEGLDVENCDLVIFYDNVPSAIRLIQRRGRTGRNKEGKLLTLIAKGTADETYHWISLRREGAMGRLISNDENSAVSSKSSLDYYASDSTLKTKIDKGGSFNNQELPVTNKVVLDERLKSTPISKELDACGLSYVFEDLGGEYIKVRDVVIKVIACSNIVSLLSSGSLFEEAIFMKTMGKPVFIIEGNPPLLASEEAGPRSSLLAISLKYGVPFIPSSGPKDSALYVAAWANREE